MVKSVEGAPVINWRHSPISKSSNKVSQQSVVYFRKLSRHTENLYIDKKCTSVEWKATVELFWDDMIKNMNEWKENVYSVLKSLRMYA